MQHRFHNYNRPLVAFDENTRLTGALKPSVYCGFDTIEPAIGVNIKLRHEVTGIRWVNISGENQNRSGCTMSRQGCFIYETEPIEVAVEYNPDNVWRVDLLVMNHSFIDSEGGANASYSVIKGYTGQELLPYQVAIGYIYIPALAVNHGGTGWQKLEPPALGGYGAFLKLNATDLITIPTSGYINDFNKVVDSGIYHINTTLNRPTGTTADWMIIVLRKGSIVSQLAQASGTGKFYGRSATKHPTTGVWTFAPWSNYNNADITGDISALQASITTINSTLAGIAVDLSEIDTAISNIQTSINNIETAIGNRTYTSQYVLTTNESITASLEKIDKSMGFLTTAHNFNDFKLPGKFLVLGEPTNRPANAPFTEFVPWATLIVVKGTSTAGTPVTYSKQFLICDNGVMYRRQYSYTGDSWSSWDDYGIQTKVYEIGVWDMDATATKDIPINPGTVGNLRGIDVWIYSDDFGDGGFGDPRNYYNLYTPSSDGTALDGWIDYLEDPGTLSAGNKTLKLRRRDGGIFDSTTFNRTAEVVGGGPFNRGWVTVRNG